MDALVFLAFAAGFLQAAWKSFERVIDVFNCFVGPKPRPALTKTVVMKFTMLVFGILLIFKARLGLLSIVAEPVFGKGMMDFGCFDPLLTGMLVSQGAVAITRLLTIVKNAADARSGAAAAGGLTSAPRK